MPKSRKSINKILKDFCRDSSIHSCYFLTIKNMLQVERILWAIINILLIGITILCIHRLWTDYLENPIITTLTSSNFPIHRIKHPALSICNLNKISKRRAYEFAKHLNKFIKAENISEVMGLIKLFGGFYDSNVYKEDQNTKLQEILDIHDNLTTEYDPSKRLLQLTTPCKDMLRHCEWGGKVYKCEDLFMTRLTYEGFCCVFNYLRPYKNDDLYKNVNFRDVPTVSAKPLGSSIENGLQVILNNNMDDYFYSSSETTGFNVQIFYPEDFPDKLSGSLSDVIVSAGLEALINIDVDVIQSFPGIKMLPISMRKCIFENEKTTIFGNYRESDCFVACRAESMKSLCNCVPFMLPIRPASKTSFCGLIDIPCLNKFKGKWSKYHPYDVNTDGLEQEVHDSLSCAHCLSPCNTVVYNVYNSLARNILRRETNTTRITVFFSKSFANLYKIDLTVTWFEILSSFGGLLSLFIGVGFVSVIEIFVLLYGIIMYHINKYYFKYLNEK